MTGRDAAEFAIVGADGSGFWLSVPAPLTAVGTNVAHWHGSVRVSGMRGFAGSTDVAHLWPEGLEEFASALEGLVAQEESEADLDLDSTQVSIARHRDGTIGVGVDLEDPTSDSAVSCSFETTVDALRQTLDQARGLLRQVQS